MRKSEFVLGRKACKRAFAKGEEIRVSAYKVGDGRTFYTDPVIEASRAGPGVLYRIKVKPKGSRR